MPFIVEWAHVLGVVAGIRQAGELRTGSAGLAVGW